MHDISTVGPGGPGSVNSVASTNGQSHHQPHHREIEFKPRPSDRLADRVELSERAHFLDQLRQSAPIRQEVVDQVRRAIDSGEYSIDDRLEPAIERLLDDLEV